MTTSASWKKVKELFHSALALEPNARANFLEEVCAGDQELKREVESLIIAHEKAGTFIDTPAYEARFLPRSTES